jgi:hypothetical protein
MASLGFGSSITFSSGFFAEITDVKIGGLSREAVDVTNFGSTGGYKEFIPSTLIDSGELEVELIYDTDATPPITGAAETITVTFPLKGAEITAAKIECSGFLTDSEESVPMDDKMSMSCTVKFTGQRTYTPGA